MKRFRWLGLVLCLLMVWTGCGDTFRPVIIPNPPAFPDPRAAHTVLAINDNNTSLLAGSADPGSIMVIDVSGDTDVSTRDVGLYPVHIAQQTASQFLVVNHSLTGLIGDSLTKVSFLGTTIAGTTTISLPPDSAPNFVAVAPADTTAYVSLLNSATVAAVSTASNSVVATISVPANPIAMAVTPDRNKLYVISSTSNSLTGINTLDRSPRPLANGGGAFQSPLWITVRSDNQRVYVLNGNGSLVTIDTTAGAGTSDAVTATLPGVGTGRLMVYDSLKNRIYIPSASQLAVVDVSQDPPRLMSVVPITTVDPSSRGSSDPCQLTATAPLNVVAAAALPDGSRLYAAGFYTDAAGNVCPQVTSINASDFSVKTNAAVPGVSSLPPFSAPICSTTPFRMTMAAGGDSSRVYLASCDAGNVNIIRTSDDSYLLSVPAPASSRAPIPPSTQPPPQSPVFLIAGP